MARRTASYLVTPEMRIVVLHGREPYLMRERSAELVRTLSRTHGEVEQFTFDGASVELATVLDELRSYGLLQQHKLVILDKADQFLSGQESRRKKLESYAAAPVDHATLLMRAETWRAGKLDRLIDEVGLVHKVEPVNEATAVKWCIARVEKRYDATLQPSAAQALVARIGPELDRLDVELAKLASFVGAGGSIGTGEVIELVGLSREQKAWAIQSALTQGVPADAIATLRELLRVSGQPEQLVTWAISDLLRKLHIASRLLHERVPPGVVARELRLWGEGRDQVLRLAREREPARIAQLLQASIDTDWRTKRGFGNPARSLEALTVVVTDQLGAETIRDPR